MGLLTSSGGCADTAELENAGELAEAGFDGEGELEPLAAEVSPDATAPVTCTLPGAAGARTPRIFVVGDSTASNYGSDLAPRMGWAQPLGSFFTPACATVQNKALSGRSSKSFYDEGAWAPVRNALRAGDYVLIQFGHNDEKSDDRARYTTPEGSYPQYLSRYLDDTLAKGATPVLLTSIQRNKWSNGKLSDTHGAYPGAVRELADKRKVALVDAAALTQSYFERIGQSETTRLFLHLTPGQSPNYPRGVQDNTHLHERGAKVIAQLVLADLARQRLPLGGLVKAPVKAP